MTIGNPTIRKIKALQQKTVARGATEHEAAAASAKAAELMKVHNISAAHMQWDYRLLDHVAGLKARYERKLEEARARREQAKARRRRRRQMIEEHGLAGALADAVKDTANFKLSAKMKILEAVMSAVATEEWNTRRGGK
jgi:hypothetical protein